MCIEKTAKQLTTLLNDQDNKVIALSGKWGTGKSHLWNQIHQDSLNREIKTSLKISLFGISEISQIKLRVLQSAIPTNKEGSKANILKAVIAGLKSAKSALIGLHSSFSALDELAILATPNLLRKKIIIIDDIERKHENLGIDEILGFIDECTQQYETRFLLILNSDKLTNKDLWETLREKVIDQEVRLNTSPSEAYDIACITCGSPFATQIKEAVKICNITNIRIIKKIIKTVNFLLSKHDQLSKEILNQIIPSTVLLSATYYKGIDEGPSFKQILSYGKILDWESHFKDMGNATPPETETWEKIIVDLGISSTDRYEELVVKYLESGLLDSSEITKELDRYTSNNNTILAKHIAYQLIDDLLWNQNLNEYTLLENAKKTIPLAKFMDATLVTALATNIDEIKNGASTAKLIISTWISDIDNQTLNDYDPDDELGRPIHKDIQTAIAASKAMNTIKLSAFDVCIKISTTKTWSQADIETLNNTTPAQYENILEQLSPTDLKDFTWQMVKMHNDKSSYFKYFSTATNNFIHACSNIVKAQQPERLSKILQRLFNLNTIIHPS